MRHTFFPVRIATLSVAAVTFTGAMALSSGAAVHNGAAARTTAKVLSGDGVVSSISNVDAAAQYTCTQPAKQTTLLDDTNGDLVVNGATPPSFSTKGVAYCLTYIQTYHWNNGNGEVPGTLGLKGTKVAAGLAATIGPFAAMSSAGQNNAPNVNWYVYPSKTPPIVINGTYTCNDSDPATWSANTVGGPGFCIVYGVPAVTRQCTLPPGAANPIARPCADLSIRDQLMWFGGQWGNINAALAKAKHLSPALQAALLAQLRSSARKQTIVGVNTWILEEVDITNNGDDPGNCTFKLVPGGTFRCAAAGIAPGQVVSYLWWWRDPRAGTFWRDAYIATATVPDPVAANNASGWTMVNAGFNSSAGVRKATASGISGTVTPSSGPFAPAGTPAQTSGVGSGGLSVAIPSPTGTVPATDSSIDHVEVAVLKLGQGTTVTGTTIQGSSCSWLSNPAGQFTTIAAVGGVCLSQIWLRAEGTTSWSYPLARPLGPGRYVVLVRTVDKAGAATSDFSAAAGTLASFTVG